MLCLAAAALAGCGDSGPPGTVTATLISPNGNEGAALFELPLEGVTDLKAVSGSLLQSQVGRRRQIAVVLRDAGKIVLQLTVADQTRPPSIDILQVSGPDDQARTLTGYRVQVDVPVAR